MEDTLLKMFNNAKTDLGNFGALTKKSYTTFDDSFNKVFENANKAFSAEKNYYEKSQEKSLTDKFNLPNRSQDEFRPDKLNDKISEQNRFDKKDRFNDNRTSSEIVSEKKSQEQKIDIRTESNENKQKLSEKATGRSSEDGMKSGTTQESNTSNTDVKATTSTKTETIDTDTKAVSTSETSTTQTEALPEAKTETSTAQTAQGTKATTLTQELVDKVLAGTISTGNADITALTETVKSSLSETSTSTQSTKVEAKTADLKTDTSNLSKDLKTEAQVPQSETPKNTPDKPKLQAQTQQILLNLTSDAEKSTTTQAQQSQQSQEQVKTPVIKATAEALAGAQALNETIKPTMKNVMEKLALTQDMMDNLKAKITNVELSTQSNNLLNQNAQEQGAKLAFEGTNNLLNTLDNNKTNSFSKTLDAAAQAPKELNKSDILTQMHTKMETLKEDGTTKITIVLKPENLGKVNLELINSKEGLVARMTAENSQVKELLDKNLDALKNSLGAQGVNVNNVTVKVAETTQTPDEMYSFNDGQQKQSKNEQENLEKDNQAFEENFANLAENNNNSETLHDGEIDYKI